MTGTEHFPVHRPEHAEPWSWQPPAQRPLHSPRATASQAPSHLPRHSPAGFRSLPSHLPLQVPSQVPAKPPSHWPRQVPSHGPGGRISQAPSQAPGQRPTVVPAQTASGAWSSPEQRLAHSFISSMGSPHTAGWTWTAILAAAPSLVRAALRASTAAWQATGALAKTPRLPSSAAMPAQATRSSFSTIAARRRASTAVPPTPRRRAATGASTPSSLLQSKATTRSGLVASGHLPAGRADDEGSAEAISGAPASAAAALVVTSLAVGAGGAVLEAALEPGVPPARSHETTSARAQAVARSAAPRRIAEIQTCLMPTNLRLPGTRGKCSSRHVRSPPWAERGLRRVSS